MSGVWRLDWPAAGSLSSQEKQLCGKGRGGKRTVHRLEPLAFRLRSIRIEAHCQCFNQGRTVGPLQRIQPGVPRGHLSAGQPDSHRSIQPAGTFCQSSQEGLAQQQALSAGGYRTEPQSASFVTVVQHNAPGIGWSLLPVPVQDSDKLFTQRIDDEWRWHGSDQRWKGGTAAAREGRGQANKYAEYGPADALDPPDSGGTPLQHRHSAISQ